MCKPIPCTFLSFLEDTLHYDFYVIILIIIIIMCTVYIYQKMKIEYNAELSYNDDRQRR